MTCQDRSPWRRAEWQRQSSAYYLGPGTTSGHALVNFAAHYDFTSHVRLGVQVDNLGDRHYYTGGQLSDTLIGPNGTPVFAPFSAYSHGPAAGNTPLYNPTFYGPGAPRRAAHGCN